MAANLCNCTKFGCPMHERAGRLNGPTQVNDPEWPFGKPAHILAIEERTAAIMAEKAAMETRLQAVAVNARPKFAKAFTNVEPTRKVKRILGTPLEYKAWGPTPDLIVAAIDETPGVPKNFVLQPLVVTGNLELVDGTYNSIVVKTVSGNTNITLPDLTDTVLGAPFYFTNNSSGNVAVISDLTTLVTVQAGGSATVMNVDGSWEIVAVSLGGGSATVTGLAINAAADATAGGAGGLAVGDSAESDGTNSIAIGSASLAAGVSQVVAGYSAVATSSSINAIAIGYAASCQGATQSVTIGPSTNNSGANSIVIGNQANVGGNNSVAMGYTAATNNASGAISIGSGAAVAVGANNGIAIGMSAQSQTASSIALGNGANASGNLAVSLGALSMAAGGQSMAVGYNSSCSGNNAVAVGGGSACGTAIDATAVGTSANALGDSSVAVGYTASVSSVSTNSIAIGQSASATAANAIVIGPGVNGGASSVVIAANTALTNTIGGVIRLATTAEVFRINALTTGGVLYNTVPATTTTPTAAQLLGGWIYVNSTATITLPTGTAMSAAITGVWVGTSFTCVLVPGSGSVTLTVAGNTGMTLYGAATAAAGAAIRLTFNCNGTNTWAVVSG